MTALVEQLEWLVIIFIYNNNYYDLEHQDTKDYYTMNEQTSYIRNQLRFIPFNKKVKIILVEVRIINSKDEESEKIIIKSSLSVLHKSLEKWMHKVDDLWRKEEAEDILTNSKSFEKILLHLKELYSAKRHIIVTAGHGSIIGINYYIPGIKPNPNITQKIDENNGFIDNDSKKNVFSVSELVSEIPLENGKRLLFLTNTEIAEAIKKVFPDKKADIVIMFNCLMQNIFTQFELKEAVSWLIAPISGIYIPGFNFYAVLKKISEAPASVSTEEVARLFLFTIRAGNNYNRFKADIEQSWKLTATRLDTERLNLIQEKFSAVCGKITALGKSSDSIYECLNDTLSHLFNHAFYCLPEIFIFDLGLLVFFLQEKIISEFSNLNSLLPYLVELKDAMAVPEKKYVFKGGLFYNNGTTHKDDDSYYAKNLNDCTLLFPYKPYESVLFDYMFDSNNYNKGDLLDKIQLPQIPSFLKNDNFAVIIKKMHSLPK